MFLPPPTPPPLLGHKSTVGVGGFLPPPALAQVEGLDQDVIAAMPLTGVDIIMWLTGTEERRDSHEGSQTHRPETR